jgi:hypothetical protein
LIHKVGRSWDIRYKEQKQSDFEEVEGLKRKNEEQAYSIQKDYEKKIKDMLAEGETKHGASNLTNQRYFQV